MGLTQLSFDQKQHSFTASWMGLPRNVMISLLFILCFHSRPRQCLPHDQSSGLLSLMLPVVTYCRYFYFDFSHHFILNFISAGFDLDRHVNRFQEYDKWTGKQYNLMQGLRYV